MKKLLGGFIIITMALVLNCCKKEVISKNEEFAALDPATPDTSARQWKPILLTAADEFTIDAPLSTSSADYTAEINEVKSWQANLTDEQKENLKFWNAGGVLRWNEILRELVAKYNLAPYQNDDGTYPIPNSANPFAYPQFPFSNPPYAARAYAYICAAQYDALIASHYFRAKFKRPTPNFVDGHVNVLTSPSLVKGFAYPAEESVIDGVTVELLKLLFPTEISYIQQRAYEHKIACLASGISTRSDLEAGEKLGKLVASKFLTRARNDKAGKAVGDVTLWKKLESDCIARGETPWISLESPSRPPMLPFFGNVKGFLADSATVIAFRPPPPPAGNSEEMKKDLEEVLWYSKNATRERIKIVHFWADGSGTYSPPGHWNAIACEAFMNEKYSEVRWARNLALLNMAMMDAAICCWDAKYFYFTPRPSQRNKDIKTLTGIPNFPSYTSGHSTFSGAASTILSYLVSSKADLFNKYAYEASQSRLYGAIHYKRDCTEGLIVGNRIGYLAIARAKSDGAN